MVGHYVYIFVNFIIDMVRPTIQEESQIELWIKSFPQSAINYPREKVGTEGVQCCYFTSAALVYLLRNFILF
jgi:hypothetical protein